jgi:hypothetical protein
MYFVEQIKKKQPKFRLIPSKKVFINTRTPVGDPAEYFETKPYGGRKTIYPVAVIIGENCKIIHKRFNYEKRCWESMLPQEFYDFIRSELKKDFNYTI